MAAGLRGALVPLLPWIRVDNVLFRVPLGAAERVRAFDDLTRELETHAKAGTPIIFPSHFFEFPERHPLQAWAISRGAEVFVQISPGAELTQFFPEIRKNLPPQIGLEWVLDRAPNEIDRHRMQQLEAGRPASHILFLPTQMVDIREEMRKFAAPMRGQLAFYFAPKLKLADANFTPDEIHLFLRWLLGEWPGQTLRTPDYFRAWEPRAANPHLQEPAAHAEFRHSCDLGYYDSHLAQLGFYPRMRKGIERAARSLPGRIILWAVYFILSFSRDPRGAVRTFTEKLYWHGPHAWYWKFFHLLQEACGFTLRAFGISRWLLGQAVRLYTLSRTFLRRVLHVSYWYGPYAWYWKAFHLAQEILGLALRLFTHSRTAVRRVLHFSYWYGPFAWYWNFFHLARETFGLSLRFFTHSRTFVRRALHLAYWYGPYAAFWKTYHFLQELHGLGLWLTGQLIRLYGQGVRRYTLSRTALFRAFHFVLWRVLSPLYWQGFRCSVILWSMLCAPAWTLKTRLPPFYWVFIFPFQKIFWFFQYQLRSRILKQTLSE